MPGPSHFRTARVFLAVTGGIAEGKSVVVAELARLGLRTVSADQIAREVQADPLVEAQVAIACGLSVPLDKEAVRDRVARDHTARRSVNRIVHGETARRLLDAEADVAEVPLLVETCLHGAFRRVWAVSCGPKVQLERLAERLGDEALATRLIASQLPSFSKAAFSDAVLRTDRALSAVFEEVRSLAEAHGLVARQD